MVPSTAVSEASDATTAAPVRVPLLPGTLLRLVSLLATPSTRDMLQALARDPCFAIACQHRCLPGSEPALTAAGLPESLTARSLEQLASWLADESIQLVPADLDEPTRELIGRWSPIDADEAIAEHDRASSLSALSPRLLASLARQLARLRQLESEFARELEREKLASLHQFAYGLSHEINNPLANISSRAQTLLRDERDPERRKRLATINSQAFRAHEMIADLMLFAQPPTIRPARLDLVEVVETLVTQFANSAAQQRTTMRIEKPELPLFIQGDREHLVVAIGAACQNSLEALREGGEIVLSLRAVEERSCETAGTSMELLITDTGPGIPVETRRHLFDPYFSGREAGRGLGLGLSKCWRIITLHGGRIDVDNPEKGAAIRIRLPPCPVAIGRNANPY